MNINEVISHLNTGIKDAAVFLSITRSSKLQLEMCLTLDELLYNSTRIKNDLILQSDEDKANLFLGFECVIGAVRAELMMWLLLKLDKPDEAWDQLIATQMGCIDAVRAHEAFINCNKSLIRLNDLESLLFPPQTFLSAGFVSSRLDCTICHNRYSSCNHLRGKPYMGEFCEVIHRDIIADHIALVDNPADKRCRINSIKTKEGYKNKLSLAITPYDDGVTFKDNETLEVKGLILNINLRPYMTFTHSIINQELQALISEKSN